MNFPKEYLRQQAQNQGIVLEDSHLDRLERYAHLLVEWNQKMNLTAITQPEEIAIKHFLDSLLLLQAVCIPQGGSLIDVGTGAGFPSLPCAIVRGDLKVTLLDSLNKRILFLQEVCREVGIQANAIHCRAEEGGRQPQLRESFQVSTARAVAHLRELAEYCLPFVQVGGVFAALKGYEVEQEWKEAKSAIYLLGGKTEEIRKFELPDGSKRSIVIIQKKTSTPAKYPRPAAKMAKYPLA